jgi:hypothetical protein
VSANSTDGVVTLVFPVVQRVVETKMSPFAGVLVDQRRPHIRAVGRSQTGVVADMAVVY